MLRRRNILNQPYQDETYIGKDLSFAASEAYKLLRTNLIFSLPKEETGRIVGVTSSIRGEGKSTTTLNLAYALAEAGRKVLLVEMDMRLPTVARRLKIEESPGLSNYLVGLNKLSETMQKSGIHERLFVITAGDIPPNPSELLGSKKLKATLEVARKNFDFIVLDLPPVNAVSDALIVSSFTDGMIMVVRQKYNTSRELDEALRQMKLVDAKMLGFVMTAGDVHDGRYGKRKYRRYGYEYGYGPKNTDGEKKRKEKEKLKA